MGEMTLKKALDEYKNVYMAYRNFAKRTRVEYQNDIEGFIEFLENSGIEHVRELGVPIIERYVAHLEHLGFAGATRKRKVVAIRSFLSFLYQDNYIDTNIGNRVVLPFADSATPNILTQAECDRLRQVCNDNPRDRAIVELLLQTGIKLSELTRLTVDDIEFEKVGEKVSGFVRVVGSRLKKSRIIPINNQAYLVLKNYLRTREGLNNNLLFLNRFDEPMGERGVQKMLRKYLKYADLGKASVQTLRHTYGVKHITNGTSLKTVIQFMGLKDIRSTSIYQTLAKEGV